MVRKKVERVTRYILKFLAVFIIMFPGYLFVRRPWKKCGSRKGRAEGLCREGALCLFVLFVAALMCLALEGEYGNPAEMLALAADRIAAGEGINMTPFHTIRLLLQSRDTDGILVNLVGNVVMFVPWGFGLVLLWRRNQNIPAIAAHSLLLPLFIETAQLFIGRSVDIDDIILNFAGGCLGAGIYFPLRKFFSQIADCGIFRGREM